MAASSQSSAATLKPGLARPGAHARALSHGLAAWRTETAARRALAVTVGAALAIAILGAGAPSTFVREPSDGFPAWVVGPFAAIGWWLPDEGLFVSLTFSALLAALLGSYAVVVACGRRVPERWGIAAVLAVHAIFMLAPPLALHDIFNYINFSRLSLLHGISPYVASPAEIPTDPTFDFTSWRNGLSPYGPLFTVGIFPLAVLPLPVAYWLLKLITVATSLLCLSLVWRIAQDMGREPLPAMLLVGLNPLVTAYALGGVRNDYFMIALLLAGILALRRGHTARSGAALMAAVGIKSTGILWLPFALAGMRDRDQRMRMAGGALAAGAALAALSLAAFGFHPPAVGIQARLVFPTSAPNLLGLAALQGGVTPLVRTVVQGMLMVAVVWLLVRTWRGAEWLTMAGWASIALVLSLPWEMPWYVMWALPMAALSTSRALRRATLVLTVFLLVAAAPFTGWLLAAVCDCHPNDTRTGKRNTEYILRFLR